VASSPPPIFDHDLAHNTRAGTICWWRSSPLPRDHPATPGTRQKDLSPAVFYAGKNQLIDYLAATPGTVSVQIKQGLAEMAEACQDIWYAGAKGETLRFERAE
jgi:uncharacterized protein DUF3830